MGAAKTRPDVVAYLESKRLTELAASANTDEPVANQMNRRSMR